MSNSLSFQHFRKFKEFPKIEFGDITFLIGKNNSGKSTFVKALLLLTNYLKSGDMKVVPFNKSNFEDLNIGTYGRAYTRQLTKEGYLENSSLANHIYVNFRIGLGKDSFRFFVNMTGASDDTEAEVVQFDIDQESSSFSISLDPHAHRITLLEKANSNLSMLYNQINVIEKKIKEIKFELEKNNDKFSREYIELNSELEKNQKNLEDIRSEANQFEITVMFTEISSNFKSNKLSEALRQGYENYIENFKIYESVDFDRSGEEEEVEEEYFEYLESEEYSESIDLTNIDIFNKNKESIKKNFDDTLNFIDSLEVYYLPATLFKYSTLFSIKDSRNSLAQTIHEYYQLNLHQNDWNTLFVNEWLKEFNVGDSLEVKQIEGEAYTVNVINNGVSLSLADAGTGAIQVVLLILRMAILIYKNLQFDKNIIVVIEEPEINLHPALQSKLADLFFSVYEDYGIKFIIETHSEYMIRRSQVITAKQEFSAELDSVNPNPFTALYFPSEENAQVYSMNYHSDGTFENSFCSGFFDASSSSTLELIKLKRQKDKK